MANGDSAESVAVGTWVKVVEHGSSDTEVFHIVESREADFLENKLPPDNPMGRALLGCKRGEEIVLDGPEGTVKLSVIEIG